MDEVHTISFARDSVFSLNPRRQSGHHQRHFAQSVFYLFSGWKQLASIVDLAGIRDKVQDQFDNFNRRDSGIGARLPAISNRQHHH